MYVRMRPASPITHSSLFQHWGRTTANIRPLVNHPSHKLSPPNPNSILASEIFEASPAFLTTTNAPRVPYTPYSEFC